jgi:hypothetical protein
MTSRAPAQGVHARPERLEAQQPEPRFDRTPTAVREKEKENGAFRTAVRTGRGQTETKGATRDVGAGSARGRWPNPALQRIAARWRR